MANKVTTIVTAQITMIGNLSERKENKLLEISESYKKAIKERLGSLFDADDVNIVVQHFVMDKED